MLARSSRVALAAFMHDLGKLAERARIGVDVDRLDGNKQTYCPRASMEKGGFHTHVHAAYTAIAWDELEATGHFPDLRKNCDPFRMPEGNGNFPDSAINAAAAHHKPETFLQWVIATADRVASGFERDEFDQKYNVSAERPNHYRARLLTLFEQIGKGEIIEDMLKFRYPLEPLSPQSIFPRENCIPASNEAAQGEYRLLWETLIDELGKIPSSHRNDMALWLDHFDSLWLTIAHSIPAATAFGVKPEVSLYDHSKTTAALATTLWRWHHEHGLETADSVMESWGDKKFLLVQGDFFGIQNFIFSEGGETNRHAHKLLRGRSFQVSLLSECAALEILEKLQLPSVCQIINAAGKFLIVAPNTMAARQSVEDARKKFDAWCLEHAYGEIGMGIATTDASCDDFAKGNFAELQKRLFEELENAKFRRFALFNTEPVFEGFLDDFDNNLGVCKINGRHPADRESSERRGFPISRLAEDQIRTQCH